MKVARCIQAQVSGGLLASAMATAAKRPGLRNHMDLGPISSKVARRE
jgi:hypothetical protein